MEVTFPDGATVAALEIGTYRMGESIRLRSQEVATLQLALDSGVRVIDTAEMYADGGAEEFVGAALSGRSTTRPLAAASSSTCCPGCARARCH